VQIVDTVVELVKVFAMQNASLVRELQPGEGRTRACHIRSHDTEGHIRFTVERDAVDGLIEKVSYDALDRSEESFVLILFVKAGIVSGSDSLGCV
jgi:hypothetical protein